MTEQEFLRRWDEEKNMYFEWGKLVIDIIKDGLGYGNALQFNALDVPQIFKDKILSKIKFDDYEIIRNIPEPRLKENFSLLQKAFYRQKKYSNPYDDITDKVGCRFIVLYSEQIKEIETIIGLYPYWEYRKDFDYRETEELDKDTLGYQSVHYVVRPKMDMSLGSQKPLIKKGIPCEIQIRTLLQHAYSEVSHDTFYKNDLVIEPSKSHKAMKDVVLFINEAERNFKEVLNDYIVNVSPKKHINTTLILNYWQRVGLDTLEECTINNTIIGTFSDFLEDEWESDFKNFYEENSYLNECIKKNSEFYMLFKQPSILLIYYIAASNQSILIEKWPFSQELLAIIIADVGEK